MDLTDRLAGTAAGAALDDAYAAAWTATDDTLLSICRDRVAMLLGHTPTISAMDPDRHRELAVSSSDRFSDVERAALDFTEQYIVDVTAITDVQAGRLREHLGDVGLVDFVNSLLVMEQRMTLELALDCVLEPTT